jgi:hypothetical protein
MGIYSRDYLRRDDGVRGKTVLWIIGLTVGAYVIQGVLLGRGASISPRSSGSSPAS